ncbi:two-component system sensor histidine kinase ZraS [Shigella flexneri]
MPSCAAAGLTGSLAGRRGVRSFAVTDEQGTIVMHSNSGMVGENSFIPRRKCSSYIREMKKRGGGSIAQTAACSGNLSPVSTDVCCWNAPDAPYAAVCRDTTSNFITFDASNIVSAEDREQRNTLIILFALATVLLASVLSFFWYRRYLRSRQLLQDEMKRKEKLVALGHLAAGVAHEIRNPLSSIKGLAKYFAERAPAGGEAHQLAQVMAKEADRLNRVVSELLELVKPTHLALQAVDLNTLINHSLQLVSQDANSREIQLRFTANDTLPEIQADPDRLTQVLLNLYLNAIQAIGQHGVISVTASESGAGVKISVTDSGKGIAADQLEAIFTPYFTTKAEGTGLGLAVVHNIVEQHGGTIQVASQEGKGSTFTLWLPVNITRKDPQG